MHLTSSNGEKIPFFNNNPLIFCVVIEPKYLYDDNKNIIINTTTSVMMKFHQN